MLLSDSRKLDLWITNREAEQCNVFKNLSSLQHSEAISRTLLPSITAENKVYVLFSKHG